VAYKGWEEVLRDFTLDRQNEPAWETVWKYYVRYREEKGMPYQCDTKGCICQRDRPQWNGTDLVLQLDHFDGNQADHRPNNLRFLCPNCHSLTPTYAGKNVGRVIDVKGNEYTVHSHDWRSRRFTVRGSGSAAGGGSAIVELIKWDK
jgi:hypothetical protein